MHILICDDDKQYAMRCRERLMLLAEKHKMIVRIDIVDSGENLLFFKDTKFASADLIYLDWHMQKQTGMEVARELRKKGLMADIVFYTIDDSHAIDGYDVEALHYIVKERTTDEKFEEIFLKAAERSRQRHEEVLLLSCGGEHRNIALKNVLYFEVKNRIVTVHYLEDEEILTFEFYSTLSKIEESLHGEGFLRIHGSYLVAERYIQKKNTQQVVMSSGEILPVGKTYRKNLG